MTRSWPNMGCRAWKHACRLRGFTIAEIMVVLVILSIMVTVAVPMGLDSTDTHAVAAASRITGDIQYAQNMAISTGNSVTVTFSAVNDTYSLSNVSGLLTHPVERTDFVVALPNRDEMSQADIVTVDFDGSSSVTFDELGAPTSGGTVVIQADATVITVSVADVTGIVKVGVAGDDSGSFGCQ